MGDILGHVGDKWDVPLTVLLRQGPRRFSKLEREVGTVSKKMLILTLRYLERDGFISRKVTPSTPPRVDYALTALGEEVMGPLDSSSGWRWLEADVPDGRPPWPPYKYHAALGYRREKTRRALMVS